MLLRRTNGLQKEAFSPPSYQELTVIFILLGLSSASSTCKLPVSARPVASPFKIYVGHYARQCGWFEQGVGAAERRYPRLESETDGDIEPPVFHSHCLSSSWAGETDHMSQIAAILISVWGIIIKWWSFRICTKGRISDLPRADIKSWRTLASCIDIYKWYEAWIEF